MKVNDQVEPLVRATLDAAVQRDGGGFEAALRGFPDDGAARKGIELALAITGTVLADLYDGEPSADQLDRLAAEVAEQEAWMEPRAGEVKAFLAAVVQGKPLADVLPAESVVILAYLVAANLLTSASNPDDGEWWFNYLDKVEAAIEAQA
jgi:hypothetical protein